MNHLHKLRTKLCRELAQSELSARKHPAREARRLGDVPPARALREIAAHAEAMWSCFEEQIGRQPLGLRLGRAVGAALSAFRHAILDRVVDAERSYRATLLGLRHGVDVMRLLRAVAAREGDFDLAVLCDEVLVERLVLLDRAEQVMVWFAERPQLALQSGLQLVLHPAPPRAP